MKIAKAEITNKKIFNKIKAALDKNIYVECGLCGAIRADAKDVAREIQLLIDRHENANDDLNDYFSDILGQIIESEPDEFETYEKYEKWQTANKEYAYDFLDADGYVDKMYGMYDELVIFNDPACDCFGKEKIKNEIAVD